MRYWPFPSVTTERTFSISAGLAASTVTPGSTAPDVSLTTPAIPLACWAAAIGGSDKRTTRSERLRGTARVEAICPLSLSYVGRIFRCGSGQIPRPHPAAFLRALVSGLDHGVDVETLLKARTRIAAVPDRLDHAGKRDRHRVLRMGRVGGHVDSVVPRETLGNLNLLRRGLTDLRAEQPRVGRRHDGALEQHPALAAE